MSQCIICYDITCVSGSKTMLLYSSMIMRAEPEITFLKCSDKVSEQTQNCSDILIFGLT